MKALKICCTKPWGWIMLASLTCDSKITLELSSTVETNMLSWKGTGFTFFCVHVVVWPSEKTAKCLGTFSMSLLIVIITQRGTLQSQACFKCKWLDTKNNLSLDTLELDLNTLYAWNNMVFIFHVIFVSPSISTSYPRCFPIIKLLILHVYHGLGQVVYDPLGFVKSVL